MVVKQEIEISVLMPVYNAEKFIAEAIRSVLNQSFSAFEFIIINDGSTDSTKEIIHSFDDPRIIVIDQPNMGVAASLNKGLRLSRAPWVARFDADDVCHPLRLEKQMDFLKNNPGYILVGSDVEVIDTRGSFIYSFQHAAHNYEDILQLKSSECGFVHSTVCYNKEAVMQVGGYDENAHTFEDHVLWKNLIKEGKACNLKEPLIKMRFNPESVTIDEKWRGKKFNRIKSKAIRRGFATTEEGQALQNIIQKQNIDEIKQGSYYALIGKKYLWNNYNPKVARENFRLSWQFRPNVAIAFLWLLSFLPKPFISFLYKSSKNKLAFQSIIKPGG
jgi:glycosyltransferase involved in cell wall biosynthesis